MANKYSKPFQIFLNACSSVIHVSDVLTCENMKKYDEFKNFITA